MYDHARNWTVARPQVRRTDVVIPVWPKIRRLPNPEQVNSGRIHVNRLFLFVAEMLE